MESTDPDGFPPLPDQAANPLAHLFRGLVGKGYSQQVLPGHPLGQEVGNAVNQDPGLAAPGSGQNQKRSLCMTDRLLLCGIKIRQ